MSNRITIIGCGKMGGTILSSVMKTGRYSVSVVEKIDNLRDKIHDSHGIEVVADIHNTASSSIYIIAVKPQSMEETLDELGHYLAGTDGKAIIVSIAAGITEDYLKQALINYKDDITVIRVMPNTPALVMEGMTAISSAEASSDDLKAVADIFNGMGETVVVDEKLMDAVTALSGSGPAYFFYFAQIMEKFAMDSGIEKETARNLAAQTILGAGRLMSEMKDTDFAQLRKNVTSPGGTTQAAIEYLESQSFDSIFYDALNKAKMRSRELSKND